MKHLIVILFALCMSPGALAQDQAEAEPEGSATLVWPGNLPDATYLRYPHLSTKEHHETLRTLLRAQMPKPLALPSTAKPLPKFQTENMQAMTRVLGNGMAMIPAWMAYGASYCTRSLVNDYFQSPYWDCLQRGMAVPHREDDKLVYNFYPRGAISPPLASITGPVADTRTCPANSAKANEFYVRCSFYDQHHLMTLHRMDQADKEEAELLNAIQFDTSRDETHKLPPLATKGDWMIETELVKLYRAALPAHMPVLSIRQMLALEACTLPESPNSQDEMSPAFYVVWFIESEEPDQHGKVRPFINVVYAPQAIPTSLMPDTERVEYEKRGIDRMLHSIPHYRCMVDAQTFERVWVKPSDQPYTFFMLQGHNMNYREPEE